MGTIEEARALVKQNPAKAEVMLMKVLAEKPGMSEEAMKEYELALMELGGLFRDARFVHSLRG